MLRNEPDVVDSKPFSRREVYTVLGNYCLAIVFLYTCYCGLETFQSTMNIESGLGTTSVGVVSGCSILSSLFVGPVLVTRLTPKRTLIVLSLAYTVHAVANFYPTWATLIPASALVGIVNSPATIAFGIYASTLAVKKTDLIKLSDKFEYEKSRQNSFVRYNAIAMSSVSFGAIAGSFIGSLVIGWNSHSDTTLMNNLTGSVIADDFNASQDYFNNTTDDSFEKSVFIEIVQISEKNHVSRDEVCGVDHCPYLEDHQRVFSTPDQKLIYIMIGIFLACNVTGIIAIIVLRPLTNVYRKGKPVTSSSFFVKMIGTFQLMSDSRLLLLIPTIMVIGTTLSFNLGAFFQSFVGCTLGIGMVGYGMISVRISLIVSSLLAGKLVECIHRRWLVIGCLVVFLSVIVTWFLWRRSENDLVCMLLWCIIIGGLRGLMKASVYGIFPTLFPDKLEYALANYSLWEQLGASLIFFINDHLCFRIKAYILFITILVALVTYSLLEFRMRDRTPSKEEHQHQEICLEEKTPICATDQSVQKELDQRQVEVWLEVQPLAEPIQTEVYENKELLANDSSSFTKFNIKEKNNTEQL